MELTSLACFDAGATTLNFRAAAVRMHLSPAAFSERIRLLEDELGAPLFVRTTRKVELSDAGRRVLPLARQVLSGAEAVRASIRAPHLAAPYSLQLGTRTELGLSWLCPALPQLQRAHPERLIHLFNGDGPDLLQRLERGDLDAIVSSSRLTSPRLTYAALHAEAYVLVARHRSVRRRADASQVTLVDVSADQPLFRYFLDALPDAEPWNFAQLEYMGGIGNIRRRLLDSADRVAVLPRYFVQHDLTAGRLVRLMPRVALRSDAFRLVWRTGHPRTVELLALADELRAVPLR